MQQFGLSFVQKALGNRGYTAVHQSKLDDFAAQAMTADKSRRLGMVPGDHLHEALQLLPESPSQLNQDFFALSATDWRRGGYFVEFGATDGRTLSNTWLLEKHFGWTGILAEPGRVWRDKLRAADRTAARDFDCVWERSGDTLQFHEDSVGEFSTLESHKHMDSHTRDHGSSYAVTTVSLRDLLDRHQAPAVIDFLSIDTEGSELQILTAYDFSRPIRAIAVEHNYTPNRVAIHGLLTAKGYLRQFEDLSEFDDWYVLAA